MYRFNRKVMTVTVTYDGTTYKSEGEPADIIKRTAKTMRILADLQTIEPDKAGLQRLLDHIENSMSRAERKLAHERAIHTRKTYDIGLQLGYSKAYSELADIIEKSIQEM